MHKEYIKNQYELAYSDFKVAKNEEQKWKARKELANLEMLASRMYGFEFTNSLRESVGLPIRS